jgi:hypothetical protein
VVNAFKRRMNHRVAGVFMRKLITYFPEKLIVGFSFENAIISFSLLNVV